MATIPVLKSIKPTRLGLGVDGNLVIARADNSGFYNEGYAGRHKGRPVRVTTAQVLALNATPITIKAAPPAGFAWVNVHLTVHKPAGTAYAGIGATENLCAKYTNGSGAQLTAVINNTGFLDQTTAQQRQVGPIAQVGTTTGGDYAPVAAAAIVLHLLVGEITTGTSDLYVYCEADLIKVAPTLNAAGAVISW